ncbi:hypothetical protein KJ934_00255, partial [Patescibacteria group bacterium]|nr:hypothetical protein [Patescibacteria group bacterium]
MNFNEIRTIVRDYINNAVAGVDQHIVDAVNFLSIVFPQKKIDNSQVTVKYQSYISIPVNCMRVRRITIAGEPVPELISFDNLDSAEEGEVMRWYEDDDKIQFTVPMDSNNEEIKIWYDISFIVDAGGKWDETRPAGNIIKYWTSVASDSDGSNLIACV